MPSPDISRYLDGLLRFLIPYFIDFTPDLPTARAEALETLLSYGARTRGELVNAVQVIILGFATLEALHEAKTTEMSPSMRLRLRGSANTLSRNGQKAEQTLLKRLAAEAPKPTDPAVEPINDLPQPQAEAALQQTQAQVDAARQRVSANRPAQAPRPQPQPQAHPQSQPQAHPQSQPQAQARNPGNRQLLDQAITNVLTGMRIPAPPTTILHAAAPGPTRR